MKKFFSIVLLLLFLFNVVGYYGVYLGLRYQSSVELNNKLDADEYAAGETITVKVPYLLPYQMDWSGYERVNGEVENNGEVFKLVKHKLEHDTLSIVYIKDHKSTDLFRSLVDFVQSNTETPISKSALKSIENLAKDYIPTTNTMQVVSIGWSQTLAVTTQSYPVLSFMSPEFSPPPESAL